ncbi:der [Symbiodinium sp. KB8]|nr:der [Symbiodinium sp. KB8]
MDTSVLPSPVSQKWLDNSTKARGLARLSSGPSLADAVFDAESAKLLEPVAPDDIQPRLSLQQIASLGPKQISVGASERKGRPNIPSSNFYPQDAFMGAQVLMAHENEMLAAGVGRLSSGKAFADYIFGMDTGELPSELPSEAYLEHFVQDHGLSRFAVNATMSMIGRAVSQLSSGKPLADAVFGCDVSHLSIPNKVVMAGTQSSVARLSWHTILQQRGCFERLFAFTALLLRALVRLGALLQAMAVPTDMTGTKLAETFSATKPLGLRPEITPCMIFGHNSALADAEGHLSKGAFDSAIPAAEAVRNEFQAKGDAVGSAHAVRVLLLAQLQKVIALEDDDVPVVTAESILTEAEKELDKSKSAGNSSAKAILQLAFTELLGFGTSRTGWSPDRPMRDKALDSANQAVDLFKEAGDTKMSAVAKLEISSLLCQGAAAKTALQAAQEAFDIFERLGDKQGMGRATWLMARSKLVAKDFDGALSKGHEALDLIRACGDKRAEALFLECLVQWSLTEGKPHKALVMAKEAFALRLDLEAPPKEEARSCLLLVEALAGVKKVRRGLKAAEECHDRLKKVGDRAQVYGLVVVAMAQLKRDHPELALTAIDEAIDIAREIGERRLEMMAQCTHAEVNVQLQSRPDALEAAEEAAAIAEELKDAKAEADCECMLVSILLRGVLDRASLVKALAAAKKAKELYKKARFRRGEAKALIHRASVLGMDTAVSSAEEMLQVASEAYDIFEEEEDLLGRSAALQLVAEAQLVKEGFDEASQAAQDRRALWKAMSSIQKALMSAREDFQREPMIMLVGAFSAGKSTLINSVLDRKACATGIEPTTCDLEFLRWEGVLLVDSAGLDAMNQPTHKEKALEAARRSNMAVVVLNARHPLRDSEGPILRELVEAKSQVVVAINYWNHVEAEEEQKQCLSYVEQTLKEWMPAKQVPIIPINAKKLDDAGVTKLRQTLLATAKKTNRQKDISAKAAIAREVRKMVIELDTFAAAAEEAHQQKCGSLEAVWTLLTKDLNPRRELRARDSEEMHRREQEMQKLQNKHAGIRDSFYETVQKSVGTGAVLSGLLAGAISSWEADEQRSQIEGQIQAKQQQIEDLESKVRTKLKQEEDIIQGFNNQLSDEKMQYQNKVARFEKGLGCRKEEGDAVLQLARILLASSEYDAAERHGMEAQKIFQEVGDKAAESVACVHLAQACLKKMSAEAEGETKEALASPSYRSSAEKAMRAANDAITACRHLGSKQLRAGALFWRAQVLGFRGRLEESLRVVLDAEKCFESAGAGSAMVQCKILAADCLAGLKHFEEAKEVADQAMKQANALHDRQAESQTKSCLERIEKAEKKSKEVVAPPVQQMIAAAEPGQAAPAAGAAPAASAVAPEQPKGLDPALATKRLMSIVKDVIAADDEITADSPLMEAGMDSLSSVQLVTEVSKEFQMTLSPSLVFDFPNVSAIVNHLVEESQG